MNRPLISRHILAWAIAGAIILPIAICLLIAVSSLLSAMGDILGGGAMRWIALGCGILWALDLIILVIALSINAINESDDADSGSEP